MFNFMLVHPVYLHISEDEPFSLSLVICQSSICSSIRQLISSAVLLETQPYRCLDLSRSGIRNVTMSVSLAYNKSADIHVCVLALVEECTSLTQSKMGIGIMSADNI
jgi:hypothetical protein